MLDNPSQNELETYGNDANDMMNTARRKLKGLISEEAACVFAEGAQAESKTQTVKAYEKAQVDMLQLGKIAATNGVYPESACFLVTIVIGLFSR